MAKSEQLTSKLSLEDRIASVGPEIDIPASQLFASSFAEALVPADQLAAMVVVQQRMLARFERTNALISTAIDVSSRRMLPPGAPQQMLSFSSGLLDRIPNTDVVQDIRRASVQLGELRDRLINVTRRIRNLKAKCSRLFPQAFDECEKSLGLIALNGQLNLADDDDDSEDSEEDVKKKSSSVSPPTKTTSDSLEQQQQEQQSQPGVIDTKASENTEQPVNSA